LLQGVFPPLILQDQDSFAGEAGAEELLALLPANAQTEPLRKKWTANPDKSSEEKWDDIRNQVKILGKTTASGVSPLVEANEPDNDVAPLSQKLLLAAMEDIVLQYTWPRIDAEVSKHRNHLLKAPFCVHPKTGRVCVPVDPTRIDEFDPATVPTVGQLLKEVDEAMVINNEDGAEGAQHLPGKSLFS
jgi:DNA primase small subunit